MHEEKNIILSVEKAIRMIAEISKQSRQTPSDLSKKLGITRTTAYRLLWTLERHGVVVANEKSEYSMGPFLLNHNHARNFEEGIIDLSLPIMMRLRNTTNETVGIYFARAAQLVAGEILESPYELRRITRVGDSLPLTKGATSICYLASRITELQNKEEFLTAIGIDKDHQEMWLKKLSKVREVGYAISWGERVPGSAAIAAPIKDSRGKIRAILSVSGPIGRIIPEVEESIADKVINAAHDIEQLINSETSTP
ncbi:hypothetical protein SD71_09780 [Cohnella kolymensis]|uniref:IclR family transcriptional regulator n=1 Tax=Cohnella kolymensis TaxID=1590652 RepID=A0ABR5A5A4_9BACL|nr:IclR family transcriptional regulator [Cohnella kolymensis]KIL36221.1 hypothetical protein SD71_09780 [Cohnella kolymensis]